MAFVRRLITTTFILGTGNFGDQGTQAPIVIPDPKNTVTNAGLRTRIHINKSGGESLPFAEIQIYGLGEKLLEQLSSVAQYSMYQRKNTVIVKAGDDDGQPLATVFGGIIRLAYADLSALPDSELHLSAVGGLFHLSKPFTFHSYPGPTDVATVMGAIARDMGFRLENNNVQVTLPRSYFSGPAVEQVRDCAANADINYFIDETNKTVAIWPKNTSRNNPIVRIAPDTGMVGFPVHTGTGMILTTLFDKRLQLGNPVLVESGRPTSSANGNWYIIAIAHDLESEIQGGGEWFTRVELTTLGNPHAQPTLNK